jgi:hypothetical protein
MTLERRSRPDSVGVIGWLCVALGGLTLLCAGMLALAAFLRRSMAEQGIDPFASTEGSLDPLSRLIVNNLAPLSLAQVLLGIVTLVIGVGFLRLRPWGRPALEILAWVTLAASVASGAWGIVAWLRPGGAASVEGLAMPVAGMILTLAQCVACGWILRYLRSREIRALFRGGAVLGDGGGTGI